MAAISTAFIDALPLRHGTPLRPERPHPQAGNDAELTLELLPRGEGAGHSAARAASARRAACAKSEVSQAAMYSRRSWETSSATLGMASIRSIPWPALHNVFQGCTPSGR